MDDVSGCGRIRRQKDFGRHRRGRRYRAFGIVGGGGRIGVEFGGSDVRVFFVVVGSCGITRRRGVGIALARSRRARHADGFRGRRLYDYYTGLAWCRSEAGRDRGGGGGGGDDEEDAGGGGVSAGAGSRTFVFGVGGGGEEEEVDEEAGADLIIYS